MKDSKKEKTEYFNCHRCNQKIEKGSMYCGYCGKKYWLSIMLELTLVVILMFIVVLIREYGDEGLQIVATILLLIAIADGWNAIKVALYSIRREYKKDSFSPSNREKKAKLEPSFYASSSIYTLITLLESKDLDSKKNAILEIGRRKNSMAVHSLIVALKNDRDAKVHRPIIWALGEIRHYSSIEPLIDCLNDNRFKRNAAEALKRITGKDFGKDAEKWKEWLEQNKGNIKSI